jgi:hypothetical protein
MGNPRYAHQLGRIVDDVYDAPITDAKAPLIFVAFKLFAPCGPWLLPERIHFADYARQHIVRQRIGEIRRQHAYSDKPESLSDRTGRTLTINKGVIEFRNVLT